MDEYKVAIVIPAFNEEATIFNVVQSVKEYGIVIVVNDASSDRTKQMSESAGAIVINHKDNMGYDGALNSGFKRAVELNCDGVITFDADGQHNSEMLKDYIDNLKKGIDLILGVRPMPARFSEWIFMFYTRIRFGWKDPLCGMKGYSMRLYRSQGYFDSYSSIGTELALTGFLHGFSYMQFPIATTRRIDTPRFGATIRSNWRIFKSLLKMVFLK